VCVRVAGIASVCGRYCQTFTHHVCQKKCARMLTAEMCVFVCVGGGVWGGGLGGVVDGCGRVCECLAC